jgi:hypothetical protein
MAASFGVGDKCHLASQEVAESHVGVQGLEAAIELDGGLDVAVPENAPDRLVVSGVMLEVDRRGGMSKLVRRDAKADRLLNSLGDLTAEGVRRGKAALSSGCTGLQHIGPTMP